MPKRKLGSGWLPKIMPHKRPDGTVRARVRFGGKDYYLGPFGSAEAAQRYRELITEWLAAPPSTVTSGEVPRLADSGPAKLLSRLCIGDLIEQWLLHAQKEYSTPGTYSELCCYKILCRYLFEHFREMLISDFGLRSLKELREHLLKHRWHRSPSPDDPGKPWSRRQVNDHVRRIVRIFRWGVSEDLVPPDVLHRLETLPPLQRGRTDAPDRPEPQPVEWARVEKTLPYLTRAAAALIHVLWLTGARSGELCGLRPCDLDRSEAVAPEWLYQPTAHKTAKHGKKKVIWFGERARKILQPFLDACARPEDFIFTTAEEKKPYRWLGRYTPENLFRTVRRAAKAAGVPAWCPKQLRSGRATQVEAQFGLDEAAAVLGDRLDITRHHYSRAKELARNVARQIG